MIDEYYFGTVERISPEAPVPIIKKTKHEYRLGGAGNVINNLKSLGTKAKLLCVVGKDEGGKIIEKLLPNNPIIETEEKPTIRKTRFLAHQQQLLRIDDEDLKPFSKELNKKIQDKIIEEIENTSLIIISDYGKGLINEENMELIKKEAKNRDIKIIVDPKKPNFELYKNTFLITPNVQEAKDILGKQELDFEEAGFEIKEKLKLENVVITRSEKGMSIYEENKDITHLSPQARQVYDVTGAGDTVIATIGAMLNKKINLKDACKIASYAAGLAVEKIGTATVSEEELKKKLEEKNEEELIKVI